MVAREVVEDDHCNCTEDLETSQDSRRFIMNIETGQDASNLDTEIAMDEQGPVE